MATCETVPDESITQPTPDEEPLVMLRKFLDSKLTRETMSILHEHLMTLNKDWYKVGLSLKVPIGTLNAIDADEDDVFRKIVAMMVSWIDNMEHSTWKVLFYALVSNGHREVVKSILNEAGATIWIKH